MVSLTIPNQLLAGFVQISPSLTGWGGFLRAYLFIKLEVKKTHPRFNMTIDSFFVSILTSESKLGK
jgi:hypothetical protein